MKNLQKVRSLKNWLVITALLMLAYQLLYTQFLLWEPAIHRIIHLGLAFTVVFLAILAATSAGKTLASKLKRSITFLLLIVGVGITVVLVANYQEMIGIIAYIPIETMVGGSIGLVFCFILSWWRFGKLFSIITLAAFLYVIFGPYFLPATIRPPQVTILRLITWVAADTTQEWGTYGDLVGYMANYIWLFMIFGSFLQAFGAIRFIRQAGSVIAAKLAGGPAVLSVVTSSLVGMVTGATTANVAITGSFTIPLMKSHGYTPEQAGAIEMTASAGGQILPPIMGVTAFILAEWIGIPYIRLIYFAFIPALIYYFTVFLYIQLQAMKAHRAALPTVVNTKELLMDAPLFVLPLLILIILLAVGYSLMFVAFWGLVSTMAVGVLSSFLRRKARLNWAEARDKLVTGAVMACEVTIVMGLLGALKAILEMSGLGTTLGYFVLELSGGNVFLLLVFSAVVCLILGTGMPTMAAYIIVATVLAPSIVSMGVPIIAAHLFIFVYAVFATITPPIGFGLIIAQRMSGGNYWRTGLEAVKAAFIVFLLPFLFVYTPAIILQLEGLSLLDIVRHFVIVLTVVPSFSCLFSNYSFVRLDFLQKGLFIIGGVSPLLSIAFPAQSWLLGIGVISCIGGFGLGFWHSRAQLQ